MARLIDLLPILENGGRIKRAAWILSDRTLEVINGGFVSSGIPEIGDVISAVPGVHRGSRPYIITLSDLTADDWVEYTDKFTYNGPSYFANKGIKDIKIKFDNPLKNE